jgi:nicotinate-nucleotide pyrophosphorylase (carboxylating)
MSGVATQTRQIVNALGNRGPILTNTRKTMPGLRELEHYAVHCGGGHSHRFNLGSGVMIKDNHIAVVGSVKDALAIAKENISFSKKIEIEVETKEDEIIAAEGGADIVMFDNMGFEESQEALKLLEEKNLRDRVLIEFSGDVNEDNILDYALLDVDIISLGALTHSSRSLNLGLDMD